MEIYDRVRRQVDLESDREGDGAAGGAGGVQGDGRGVLTGAGKEEGLDG